MPSGCSRRTPSLAPIPSSTTCPADSVEATRTRTRATAHAHAPPHTHTHDAAQTLKRFALAWVMVSVGAGAYSNSRGERTVRGHVAEFISERDGFACDMEDVFLTDGASAGVVKILQCLIRDEKDGVRELI